MDEMSCVLGGIGFFRLENANLNGDKEVAVNIIMDTLYELNKQTPEEEYDIKTQEAFESALKSFKTVDALNNSLRALEYHLYAKKNNIATFDLNCNKILECLKTNLLENKDFFNEAEFQKMLKDHNNYISSNFGLRF